MIASLTLTLVLASPAAPAAALAAASAPGKAPELAVTFAPLDPTVGDRITAVLTLTTRAADLAGEPVFPVWEGHWGQAEIFEVGEVHRSQGSAGTAVFEQRLVLAAFAPGELPLPPVQLEIPYQEGPVAALSREDLSLQIRSVLPAPGEEVQPAPAAAPIPLPWGAPFFWTVAALAAACGAAAVALWKWQRPLLDATPPLLAPFAELELELARVPSEMSSLVGHTRLSRALRRYLGRSLHFPAVESTTTEIRHQLHDRRLPQGVATSTVEVLRECDLVKFARREPEAGALARRLDATRELAERVERHLHPPEISATAGGPPAPPSGLRLPEAG